MRESSRYTITAALPYANGPVHIGHLAGVYLPADIFARYMRTIGNDVLYVCGSDEHGVPITLKAKKLGVSPNYIIDKYHEIIKKSFDDFGISFDIYSRTSNDEHHSTAQEFFLKLIEKKLLVEKNTDEFFDVKEKTFLADRYILGTCPVCEHKEAYGDQCEKCGASLDPSELINPTSAISGGKLTKKKTKHWYLPLGNYESFLKDWIITKNKSFWKSNVVGQCKSWIESGLRDRAVTRDLEWGVKVPMKTKNNKVLYVWFDAPIGYISATKSWAKKNNKDWKKYWKNTETKLVHFIGKDNIVFHCIIFPSMLKAHGEFILPHNVPANEFLNLEGKKISTSKNWAVWLNEYLEGFPNKQDVLRYVLCTNAPENKDNDFTWLDFQTKNNSELVAILGNFINRVFVLCHKYWNGKVPKINKINSTDSEVMDLIKLTSEKISQNIENYKFRFAIQKFMELARIGNKYLADTEPWKLFKNEDTKHRTETILHIAIQITAAISITSEPFMPFTSKKIKNMLNILNPKWEEAGKINIIDENHKLNKPELLFSKIEDSEIEVQINKLKNNNN